MMEFKKVKLSKFFKRETTNIYKNYNSDDLIMDKGTVPVVGNSSKNNGIIGFSNYKALNNGNVITFSDTVNPEETIFYQKEDFIGFSHVNKLIPLFSGFNEVIALYVITSFKKSIKDVYDYNKKFTSEIGEQLLELPISNEVLDLKYMEEYILKLIPEYYEYAIEEQKKINREKIKQIQNQHEFIKTKFLQK